MLTRIEVSGFKSLQGFTLDLDPFTALVGPNGAGKSNILDALALLSRIASGDLATALQGGRGRIREQFSSLDEDSLRRGWGTLGSIELAAEALLLGATLPDDLLATLEAPLANRLRYELTLELQLLSSGAERCVLKREKLLVIPEQDAWMERHPSFRRQVPVTMEQVLFSFEQSLRTIDDPSGLQATRSRNPIVVQSVQERAYLMETALWAVSPHLRAMAEELRRVRVVHLEPRLLREPSEPGAPPMTAEGAHLASTLAALSDPDRRPRQPGAMARVRARLASLIPGARTVEVVPSQGALQVEIELTDSRRFASRVLSDGTLRVLGLLTWLEVMPPGGALAIEEPENGVHPARARVLVNVLRDAASVTSEDEDEMPAQVIITSHSPAVLAALMDQPEDIVFIDMVRQGAAPRRTRARRVTPDGASDRGEHTVSINEIERLLATTRSLDERRDGP